MVHAPIIKFNGLDEVGGEDLSSKERVVLEPPDGWLRTARNHTGQIHRAVYVGKHRLWSLLNLRWSVHNNGYRKVVNHEI